jgi:hypothetical protein
VFIVANTDLGYFTSPEIAISLMLVQLDTKHAAEFVIYNNRFLGR